MADDLLLIFLRDRDVPCPACAYNLRDLTKRHCPECGHGVKLRVKLAERSLKAWGTLLVVCGLGAGMGLFFIVMMIIFLIRGELVEGSLKNPLALCVSSVSLRSNRANRCG